MNKNLDAKTVELSNDVRGITDVIGKILDGLKNIVETVIKNAIEFVDDLLETLKNVASGVLQVAKDTIKNIINGILENIKQLQDQAAQLGIDVSDCVNAHSDELQEIANESVENINKCITDQMDTASNLVTDIKGKIQVIVDKIKNLQTEASNCHKLSCYANIVVEGSALVATVPEEVKGWITQASDVIYQIQEDLPSCLYHEIDLLQGKVTPIADEVTKCIKDKLPNPEHVY